ncbi:hypothetical protein PsorP6_001675 [Peronosclerospora sorghi]|uniref:Uncharacterized protein n=1 Tax=Peronosclerospora sorghi TaxID=230839 RepID=A0ACC0WYW1_9STRA|nr:hypothetical protein PsorP6_001675 [Peronosclerospora sorghi]
MRPRVVFFFPLSLALVLLVCHVSCLSSLAIPRACSDAAHAHFPFCNASVPIATRVDDLLHRLPLELKVTLLTARASPRGNMSAIGLPAYNWGANCVHGVQSTCGTHCATSFPNPVNLGAIFDPRAVHAMAQVIGWELRGLWLEGATENYAHAPRLGLDCWSPTININRDPRWGRNMESPSEDPLVNSKYSVAYTRGVQEGKEDPRFVQALVTLKHYLAYSYDHYAGVDRMAFNAVVSSYDFADTYVVPFHAAVVHGRAKGVMCAYNSVNGVPMCANKHLNTHVLRETLGFDGYITSDSGALEGMYRRRRYTKTLCDAAKLAILAGTDINSGSVYEKCLPHLVKRGHVSETVVNDAVRRTLTLRFQLGLFDPIADQPYWHVTPDQVHTAHAKHLSLDLARKSVVLLQNHHNVLPLAKGRKLAVLGPHATARRALLGNYAGQVCHGDYTEVQCVETPVHAIARANGVDQTLYARGSGLNDSSTRGFRAAVAAAREAEAVLLFLGIDTSIEHEDGDRDTIELPRIQRELLKRVRRVGKPTVVVLFNGGILGAEELVLYTDGLLEAFYPGFYGAQAISDLVFGHTVPSGKLPVTMYPSQYIHQVEMKSMSMTKYPGRSYRYYKHVPVFPFGWGLSYTRFTLAKKVSNATMGSDPAPRLVTRAQATTIAVILSNDGDRAAEEVVFVFFRPLQVNVTGPAASLNQQLVDYRRLELAPAQSRTLEFPIEYKTVAMVDEHGNRVSWPGFYQIIVTNGVYERVSFVIHVVGETEVLEPFLGASQSIRPRDLGLMAQA